MPQDRQSYDISRHSQVSSHIGNKSDTMTSTSPNTVTTNAYEKQTLSTDTAKSNEHQPNHFDHSQLLQNIQSITDGPDRSPNESIQSDNMSSVNEHENKKSEEKDQPGKSSAFVSPARTTTGKANVENSPMMRQTEQQKDVGANDEDVSSQPNISPCSLADARAARREAEQAANALANRVGMLKARTQQTLQEVSHAHQQADRIFAVRQMNSELLQAKQETAIRLDPVATGHTQKFQRQRSLSRQRRNAAQKAIKSQKQAGAKELRRAEKEWESQRAMYHQQQLAETRSARNFIREEEARQRQLKAERAQIAAERSRQNYQIRVQEEIRKHQQTMKMLEALQEEHTQMMASLQSACAFQAERVQELETHIQQVPRPSSSLSSLRKSQSASPESFPLSTASSKPLLFKNGSLSTYQKHGMHSWNRRPSTSLGTRLETSRSQTQVTQSFETVMSPLQLRKASSAIDMRNGSSVTRSAWYKNEKPQAQFPNLTNRRQQSNSSPITVSSSDDYQNFIRFTNDTTNSVGRTTKGVINPSKPTHLDHSYVLDSHTPQQQDQENHPSQYNDTPVSNNSSSSEYIRKSTSNKGNTLNKDNTKNHSMLSDIVVCKSLSMVVDDVNSDVQTSTQELSYHSNPGSASTSTRGFSRVYNPHDTLPTSTQVPAMGEKLDIPTQSQKSPSQTSIKSDIETVSSASSLNLNNVKLPNKSKHKADHLLQQRINSSHSLPNRGKTEASGLANRTQSYHQVYVRDAILGVTPFSVADRLSASPLHATVLSRQARRKNERARK